VYKPHPIHIHDIYYILQMKTWVLTYVKVFEELKSINGNPFFSQTSSSSNPACTLTDQSIVDPGRWGVAAVAFRAGTCNPMTSVNGATRKQGNY